MKVLHATDASSAGVLTSVTTLARAQASSGFFDSITFGYVRRADTPTMNAVQQLAGPDVRLDEWSSATGAARLLGLTKGLSCAALRGDYDVIHCHSSRAGFIGRLAGRLTGSASRIVYSPHCFAFARTDIGKVRRAVYRKLETWVAVRGGEVLAVSDSEGALAREILPHAAVAVLPNVVDSAALWNFAQTRRATIPRAPSSAAGRTRRVVNVGRIAEQKAPDLFRATIAALDAEFERRQAVDTLEVTWLGDGARSLLGDCSRIQVSGWLAQEELHERLATADVMLFTSRGEGMPLALVEAQAMGVPIVASNVSGVADVVAHDVTGFLGTSPEELAHDVCRLLSDGALVERIRGEAHRRAEWFNDLGGLAERSMLAYSPLPGRRMRAGGRS